MFTLSESAIISTTIEAALYGFSILMFILTLWLLLRNQKSREVNYGIIAIACALVTLSTSELIVNLVRVCQGFLNIGPTLPGGPEQYFSDISLPLFVAKSTLYNTQTLILDGVVIYRTYVVWNNNPFIIIFPALGWCGLLAAVIGTNWALATAGSHSGNIFVKQTGEWITANYAMTLATNLSATILLAFRIWRVNRKTSAYRANGLLSFAMRAVIESGAIYSATIIAALVSFVRKTNGVFLILDLISPIISIVFFMLIIRIRLASDAKSFIASHTVGATSNRVSSSGIRNLYEMKTTTAIAVEVSQYKETDHDYHQESSSTKNSSPV